MPITKLEDQKLKIAISDDISFANKYAPNITVVLKSQVCLTRSF